MRRAALLIFVLAALGVFLWAAVNMTREYEMAAYTSSLEGREPAQMENLQLASSKIDGYVLKPGELFSFNEVVGERLRHWGYKGAPTIFQGRMVDTPGGGLCQLSSTIYNTALLSGMEIIERSPHVWTISSVGPGLDAAIYLDRNGEIDLKFRNLFDFPVKIKCEMSSNRLTVRILSPIKPGQDISVQVETLQVYPAPMYPSPPEQSGPPQGGKGRDGCKVKVWRTFSSNGRITRQVVSVDKYEPVPGSLLY